MIGLYLEWFYGELRMISWNFPEIPAAHQLYMSWHFLIDSSLHSRFCPLNLINDFGEMILSFIIDFAFVCNVENSAWLVL